MFSVGQTVYHKTRKTGGQVLEVDGETVYLATENGVEVAFPAKDLTEAAPVVKHREIAEAANLSRVLTMDDITDAHRRVLSVIPQRTMQTVAALFERQPKAGRFSALDVARKLNYIAEVTAVPYRTMKEYSDQPGTLALMMGRGLSISTGSAR